MVLTVNENIRRIRLEKGMTQKQVAQACGTADAYIRAYELGKYNPKPATVAKIAKALGVTPAELYGMGETGPSDPDTEFALFQTEMGGLVDEATINKRRLLAAFDNLNSQGQEVVIKWAEELTTIPTLRLCRSVADVLAALTEDEQQDIQHEYHVMKRLELEKAQMEKKQSALEAKLIEGTPTFDKHRRRFKESLEHQEFMIKERGDSILKIILAALERFETSSSGK